MKSFLIIGMSTFGQHLCSELNKLGGEVMIADKDEQAVEKLMRYSVSAKIADCTNEDVIKAFGVDEFDACFVCLGGCFSDSLEITYLLKEYKAKRIIVEINRDVEAKFMKQNGCDQVIYPEKDFACRVAKREISDAIFDAIELADGYSVFETEVPSAWLGKSVIELDVRAKYNINIIAIKNGEHITPFLSPSHIFKKEEHIMMLGHLDTVRRLLK